jgi:sulfate adenylyltransferase subunit 2
MRVFPLSNWTEMDVWEYIGAKSSRSPPSISATSARCVRRGGQWLPVTDSSPPSPARNPRARARRPRPHHRRHHQHRLIESPADTVDDIIAEIAAARVTERGSRADDKASEAAMEDRKKQGYF